MWSPEDFDAFCESNKVLLFPEVQQPLDNHLGGLTLCWFASYSTNNLIHQQSRRS